jgi:hypothetical protein
VTATIGGPSAHLGERFEPDAAGRICFVTRHRVALSKLGGILRCFPKWSARSSARAPVTTSSRRVTIIVAVPRGLECARRVHAAWRRSAPPPPRARERTNPARRSIRLLHESQGGAQPEMPTGVCRTSDCDRFDRPATPFGQRACPARSRPGTSTSASTHPVTGSGIFPSAIRSAHAGAGRWHFSHGKETTYGGQALIPAADQYPSATPSNAPGAPPPLVPAAAAFTSVPGGRGAVPGRAAPRAWASRWAAWRLLRQAVVPTRAAAQGRGQVLPLASRGTALRW